MAVRFKALKQLILMTAIPSLFFATTAFAAQEKGLTEGPNISTCPNHFHTFPLPANAKQCQRFDADLPATLVFHASDTNDKLIEHYVSAYPGLEKISTIQGRTLLTADNNNIRVVISPDSQGSQVDIMMIETSSYLTKN